MAVIYHKALNHVILTETLIKRDKKRVSSHKITNQKRVCVEIAFQHDCEILMRKFSDTMAYDFNIFCDLWTEQDFSLIYGGHYQTMQMGYYMQFFFNTAKKFVIFGHTKSMQVGGIFLLYALYYKQPAESTYKISILQSEYEFMENFVEEMLRLRKLEVVYIFYKMVHSCAFEFVCTQYKLVLGAGLGKSDLVLENTLYQKEDLVDVCENTKTEMDMVYKVDSDYQKLLNEYLTENNVTIDRYPLKLRESTDTILNGEMDTKATLEEDGGNSHVKNMKFKAFQTNVGTWRDKLVKPTNSVKNETE